MMAPEAEIALAVEVLREKIARPIIVAIDGGSGAGKSTIGARLAQILNSVLVPLDDFYQTSIPERVWPEIPMEERWEKVFDWKRIRADALIPLSEGRPGQWQAFDFSRGWAEAEHIPSRRG